MDGETDLHTLLGAMWPLLHPTPYVFCSVSQEVYDGLPFQPIGVFREEEGITVVAEQEQAASCGLSFEGVWACITLTVHSSLFAVGFLAAITARLAAAGIGVNVVSAYYHDHLFVPWERREQALAHLRALSASACGRAVVS